MRGWWRVRRRLQGAGAPTVDARPPGLSFGAWERLASDVLVVCHPDWRGVRVAAYAHREPVVEVADAGRWAADLAAQVEQAGVRTVVAHGYPPGTDRLLRELARRGVRGLVVLHSSMAQHGGEAGEAAVADAVATLARDRVVERIGFVKQGLAEAFAELGYPASWVPNRAPRLPAVERLDLGRDRFHVGVFAEPFWRKNVVTQLAAVALLDGRARAHVLHRPEVGYLRALDVAEHGEVAWERFVQLQASVDLNLYVTLSECYPLSPIESYLCDVPCLTSRASSVFRDDPALWAVTTVETPDDPQAIADGARRLLEGRDEAVRRARSWIARWDELAGERWRDFTRG
ncbi:MAG TPA: hypothetical protein VHF25_12320 [Nitriliruptorales bacterium]|nr:hypothetical protein [Nitriliruptorales bacterium]